MEGAWIPWQVQQHLNVELEWMGVGGHLELLDGCEVPPGAVDGCEVPPVAALGGGRGREAGSF